MGCTSFFKDIAPAAPALEGPRLCSFLAFYLPCLVFIFSAGTPLLSASMILYYNTMLLVFLDLFAIDINLFILFLSSLSS